MKITRKQRQEIDAARYFSKAGFDASAVPMAVEVRQVADGLSPEEAYLAVTTHGKKAVRTTDATELYKLLWGQKWLNLAISDYTRDINAGDFTLYEVTAAFMRHPAACAYLLKAIKRGLKTCSMN